MSYTLCQGWILPPVFKSDAFKCPLHACSVTQSYLIICEPMNCSPSDSSVHGILQARILKWVAFSYFRGSSQPNNWTHVSHVSCIARGFFIMKPLGKPFMSCQRAFLVCKGMLNHSTEPQRAFRHMLNSHFEEYLIFLPSQVGREGEPWP